MPKPYRGKTLWKLPARGRGTCPLCGRTRIKLLYTQIINGENTKVCKHCRHKRLS